MSLRSYVKMNGGIILPSLVTTTNTMMWTGCLVFINMNMNLSLDWYPNILKSLCWIFWHICQLVQYTISKFLKEWIASWGCFPHRKFPTDSNLLKRMQNLKEIKCICKIKDLKWQHLTHYTLYIYMYIYTLWLTEKTHRNTHTHTHTHTHTYYI